MARRSLLHCQPKVQNRHAMFANRYSHGPSGFSYIGMLTAISLLTLSLVSCGGTVAPSSPGNNGGGGGGGGGKLACNVMTPGVTASLGGFLPFTASSLWN